MSLTGRTIKGRGEGYRRILSTRNFPQKIEDERKLELLGLIRVGNKKAKDELILSHIRLVVSIVDRYISNFNCRYLADELEDAAIEGLIVAISRVEQGCLKHDNVTGYIVIIVHRYVSDCLRKSSLIPAPRGHIFRQGIPIHEGSVSCNPGEMSEIRDLIDCSIRSKKERRVVDLKIKGFTDKEVGEIMDIPQTAVFRIRQTLKTRFERLNRDD